MKKPENITICLSTRGYLIAPMTLLNFIFTKFVTEERDDNGGVSGALLHFLMEWGLTPQQEAEVKSILKSQHQGARLLGPVDVEAAGDDSFRIISATVNESESGFTETLVTSGKAPVLPGQKIAVASRLDKFGAQLLAATFEKNRSITNLSVYLGMKNIQEAIPVLANQKASQE